MRLSAIRHLYQEPGPFASVYLEAPGLHPDARRLVELHWRRVREQLASAGADEGTLAAIDAAMFDGGPAITHDGRAMVAAHGEIRLNQPLSRVVPGDSGTWSARPRAAGLVRGMDEDVHWVRADVDRAGGTVTTDERDTTTVVGEFSDVITKASGVSRSIPRSHQAVETNWIRNSREVASVVTAAAARIDPDVVMLSGDLRARQLVAQALPVALADRVVQIDHESPTRARFDPELEAATRGVLADVSRAHQQETLDRFHAGLASGSSVRGLAAVAEAGRDQRIEVLLLADDVPHRPLWVDPDDPTMVGMAKRDVGVAKPLAEPADDALIGVAAMTDAATLIIEADPALVEGVGAILRYT